MNQSSENAPSQNPIDDAFSSMLGSIKPAPHSSSVAITFYRAGFAAGCQTHEPTLSSAHPAASRVWRPDSWRRAVTIAIAASFLTGMVGFQLGSQHELSPSPSRPPSTSIRPEPTIAIVEPSSRKDFDSASMPKRQTAEETIPVTSHSTAGTQRLHHWIRTNLLHRPMANQLDSIPSSSSLSIGAMTMRSFDTLSADMQFTSTPSIAKTTVDRSLLPASLKVTKENHPLVDRAQIIEDLLQ